MFLIKKDHWEVKTTKDKGDGVFAKKEIPKGTVIGDYLGKIIKTSQYDLEKDKDGLYLMYYSDEFCIYPDLKKSGIHLFNHSCSPNCWIYNYFGHTLFFALRDIKKGEEFTISYLLAPKDTTCNPCTHDCKCGSKNCTGTMHLTEKKFKKWQQFQDNERNKTKVLKVTNGEYLKRLKKYPKSISLSFIP